ncbi:N-6 DNA methylase, partial [Escherichia coli]|nr:N-6 DNA methylase [Escherichia coli]EJO9114883.1 N-6 DNA methylase [Escherichia coli]
LGWIAIWADIDLTPYDNSEVTTLEEHIKRQWADMSAETAGQQYTPSDIIALISELAKRCNPDLDGIIRIYDPTCGGGNMLFGVEDKFKELARNKGMAITTKTYGQELEGSLYALAKIESYFRIASYIEKGNTLTDDKFATEKMDFVVANPPYGVDWKEYKKAIEADATGRFDAGKPSTSDGQLLFLQHIVDKLNDNNGQAFVVLNGSPMFSGDAGSGESNIRKWLLDKDYVRALIQLPTGEFFNTGISTYI